MRARDVKSFDKAGGVEGALVSVAVSQPVFDPSQVDAGNLKLIQAFLSTAAAVSIAQQPHAVRETTPLGPLYPVTCHPEPFSVHLINDVGVLAWNGIEMMRLWSLMKRESRAGRTRFKHRVSWG